MTMQYHQTKTPQSHPPRSSSTRRPHLAALPTSTPNLLIILIRRNLAPSLWRLVHRWRRVTRLISRRRRESAVLHAVAVRVLLLAVIRVLVVHWRAVRVVVVVGGVVVVARRAGPHHPAVVGEGCQVLAQTAARVPVAADEVGEEQEEEDRDYGVADGGAGLDWLLVLC